MEIPKINHPTGRPNFTVVVVKGRLYWFSYQTCVAFQDWNAGNLTVRQNEWGPTTGKHLNYIDGGATSARVDGPTFEARLSEVVGV
jgi:hypothetical protein